MHYNKRAVIMALHFFLRRLRPKSVSLNKTDQNFSGALNPFAQCTYCNHILYIAITNQGTSNAFGFRSILKILAEDQ